MVDLAADDEDDGGDMAQIQLAYPIPMPAIMTQSYTDHVQRARANGWCTGPGNCPGGVYYYGGIDWAIPTGTPVRAAASGRVTVARLDASGYGVHVRIEHPGGYLTVYGHLSIISCGVGQDVQAGQVIGKSGNTGNSTGPHLHFEVRHNGQPIDPQPLIVQADPETDTTPVMTDYQAGDQAVTIGGYYIRTSPEIRADNIVVLSRPGIGITVADVAGDWIATTVYIHRDGVTRR